MGRCGYILAPYFTQIHCGASDLTFSGGPEYCFELGWNTLRDLLLAEGNAGLIGSRDTLRLAFRVGLIGDGEAWLAMVQDRNLTSHTYNRSTAEQVSQQVEARYLPCFRELRQVLSQRVQATAAEEGDG